MPNNVIINIYEYYIYVLFHVNAWIYRYLYNIEYGSWILYVAYTLLAQIWFVYLI